MSMRNIQPVNIAGIEFDAIIDSSEAHTASVPEYPVDSGYSVSDNLALSPMTLSMTLFVTATPVTWLSRHGRGEERVRLVGDQLMDLFESREMFEVVTPDRVYENMVISDLEIKRSQDIGYAVEIPITLKQVTITVAAVTMIPASYARSGSTGASTGNASAKDVSAASAGWESDFDENVGGLDSSNDSADTGGGADISTLYAINNNSGDFLSTLGGAVFGGGGKVYKSVADTYLDLVGVKKKK